MFKAIVEFFMTLRFLANRTNLDPRDLDGIKVTIEFPTERSRYYFEQEFSACIRMEMPLTGSATVEKTDVQGARLHSVCGIDLAITTREKGPAGTRHYRPGPVGWFAK